MLNHPKCVAAEPFFSGGHYLLYQVALFMRNFAYEITPEQLQDLGDAIHNVPQALLESGDWFTESTIRDVYLKPYDDKWANGRGKTTFSLITALDNGIAMKLQLNRGN